MKGGEWIGRGGGRVREGGREIETEGERVNLVSRVDPQLEGHSPRKLVSVAAGGDVVGVDLALNVDVLVGCYVQELDGDERLRVVDLSFLAIVWIIHEVESAIWREVLQLPYFVRIFFLWGRNDNNTVKLFSL